jgi:phosphoribosylanthranilate isomerase
MAAPAIKICGISSVEALDASIKARADYVGFVFFPPSPRHLALADAAELSAQAAGRIKRVGLFVDADDELLAQAVAAARLDVLQLHGGESPARVVELKARFGLPVWKALPVASSQDVLRADAYTGAADLILFDAKTPRGTLPGGMGLAFDWNLVAGWKGACAWGLAGGLCASNIAEALRITGAALVDTSSGVESVLGVKDVDRIAAFAYAARQS